VLERILPLAKKYGAAVVGLTLTIRNPLKRKHCLFHHGRFIQLRHSHVYEAGCTHYNVSAKEFAASMARYAEIGVTVFGGCCGSTPEYIRASAPKPVSVSAIAETGTPVKVRPVSSKVMVHNRRSGFRGLLRKHA